MFGYGDFGPWESQCISVLNLPFFDDPFFLNGVHANFNTQFCQLLSFFQGVGVVIFGIFVWDIFPLCGLLVYST